MAADMYVDWMVDWVGLDLLQHLNVRSDSKLCNALSLLLRISKKSKNMKTMRKNKQTDKQIDRQTGKETGRQTNKQTTVEEKPKQTKIQTTI